MAGVNEATLFRHFGNKAAAIEACAVHYCSTVQLQELLTSLSGDLEGDLRLIAWALADRMEQVRDLIVMSLAEEETDSAVGNAAWRAPEAIKHIVAEFMAGRVESGELVGDPVLLARFFMGMIFAQVIGRKKFPQTQYSTHEIVDFQLGVFLNGVRSGK